MPEKIPQSTVAQRPSLVDIAIHCLPMVLTGIALLVGTALRWAQLGARSLWFDEGYTAWVVSRPLGEIIRIIRADTAPPLYYLILREWTLIFGRSETAMRSLSALFATLTLAVFLALARRILKNPWAVTIAVWLFALSFMQIAYAHEARFYSMMALLGAIDLYLVLLVCERSSPWRIAALVVAWTASLYTNNVMAIYLAFLGCAWLIAPGNRPRLRRVIDLAIATILSALAFAPWLSALSAQMHAVSGHFWPEVPDAPTLVRSIAVMAGVHQQSLGWFGEYRPGIMMPGLVVVDLALLGFVLATLRMRRHAAMVASLLLFGVAPIVFVFVWSHVAQSIYMDRAFIASTVAMPLLAVLPLTLAKQPWQHRIITSGLLVLIWLCAWSLPIQRLGTQDEDWRDAMAWAVHTPAKHRLVVFVANEGETLYDYYVRGSDYSPRPDLVGAPSSFFAVDPPRTMRYVRSDDDLKSLRQVLSNGKYDEVVFVASHNWFADPDHLTLKLLQSRLVLVEQKTITRMTVFRFSAGDKMR